MKEFGLAIRSMARVVVQAARERGVTREVFLEFCGKLWDELAASEHNVPPEHEEQDQT